MGEILFQQLVGADYKILLLVALDGDIGHLQVAVDSRGELRIHLKHLKGILDTDGVEHGLEIVVAVGSLFNYVEPKVDFRDGKCNHAAKIVIFDEKREMGNEKLCLRQ